jgi:hypothetical protein
VHAAQLSVRGRAPLALLLAARAHLRLRPGRLQVSLERRAGFMSGLINSHIRQRIHARLQFRCAYPMPTDSLSTQLEKQRLLMRAEQDDPSTVD